MRQLDPAGDGMQPLGPPERKQQGVAIPLPKPTGTPGVFEMPDGKLQTNLPLPPQKPAVRVHDSICEAPRQSGKSRIISVSPIPPDFRVKRTDVIVFDDIEDLP
jgi:hypothetical protein